MVRTKEAFACTNDNYFEFAKFRFSSEWRVAVVYIVHVSIDNEEVYCG